MSQTPNFNDKAKAKNLGKFMMKSLDFFAGELAALTFIEQGANLTLRDAAGNTALMLAVKTNKQLAAAALIENGASVKDKDAKGFDVLKMAILDGNKPMANLLVNRGARLTIGDAVALAKLCAASAKSVEAMDCLTTVAASLDRISGAAPSTKSVLKNRR